MATVTVSSSKQLAHALETAKGGDLILMKPGDYNEVSLSKKTFSSNVTVSSLDPNKPAHIDQLMLKDVENLTFKSIDFGRGLSKGEHGSTSWISVYDSKNVVFDGVHVHGSLDKNPANDGYGMDVRNSHGIDVLNSEFQQLGRGLKFMLSTDLNIVNNHVHDIRSDGMDFAQTRMVVIDRNRLHDFYPVKGDHADAIQFMSKGMKAASTDIRITNNVIMQGDGKPAQGIFLKDETTKLPYEKVLIANNLVYMNAYNGITVARGRDIEVVGNTVLSQTDNVRSRIWLDHVSGARVEDNVTEVLLNLKSSKVHLIDNIVLKDAPGKLSLIPDINAGADAVVSDLIVKGYGYQPKGGQTPTKPTTPTPPSDRPSDPAPVPEPVPEPDPTPRPPRPSKPNGKSPVADAIATALGERFDDPQSIQASSAGDERTPAAWKLTSPAEGAAVLTSFVEASVKSALVDALGGSEPPIAYEAAHRPELEQSAFGRPDPELSVDVGFLGNLPHLFTDLRDIVLG